LLSLSVVSLPVHRKVSVRLVQPEVDWNI
jgi:hypothetical protein